MPTTASSGRAELFGASARALLEALRDIGGEASPAELAERTGIAASTISKWLGRLRGDGLVDGPKPRPRLTSEGWAAIERSQLQTAGGSLELGQAIERWPTEAHRAFLRLLVAAIVARRHLATQRPDRHPAFVAAGTTGSGKSSMAEFACRVFGIDPAAQIMLLSDCTRGAILGRTEHADGGGWTFTPSPLLVEPLIVFDEFDKGERDVRQAALMCCHGSTRRVIENTPVALRAVPMLACNTPQGLPVPDEFRRRAIVLDTAHVAIKDLDLKMRELRREGGPPRLDLDRLRPAGWELPEDVFALMRSLVLGALTDRGAELYSADSLELIALGYTGGVAPASVNYAEHAVAAARDYLTCAETVSETRPGWRGELRAHLAGDQALEAGHVERRQIEASRTGRELAKRQEQLDLLGDRQLLAEQLRQAYPDARTVPACERPAAKALKAQLASLRSDVEASRSRESLEQLRGLTRGPLQAAGALEQRLRQARHRASEEKRAQQAAAQAEARAARVNARSVRDAQRAARAATAAARRAEGVRVREQRKLAGEQLTTIRAQARPLETMWRRTGSGSALEALHTATAFGRPLLAFEASRPDPGEGRIMRVLGALSGVTGDGTWVSPFDPAVRFWGTRSGAERLTWGGPARSVLLLPLRHLHAQEDELCQVTGRRPRQRPALF
jgi:hypothetical protein